MIKLRLKEVKKSIENIANYRSFSLLPRLNQALPCAVVLYATTRSLNMARDLGPCSTLILLAENDLATAPFPALPRAVMTRKRTVVGFSSLRNFA